MKSREQHGDLSNMTFGYPLHVNSMTFQGPEGLYQALKFPGSPETQQRIAQAGSGIEAKKIAYGDKANFRPDWEQVRIHAMAFTPGRQDGPASG